MKLYTLDEMKNHIFDDKEIMEILSGDVLIKSCILAMFRYVKSSYSDKDIFEFVKQDDWMNRKHWTWLEHDMFTKELARVYKNIYSYSNVDAIRMAQHFIFKYGFKVKDTIVNENKHYKHLLDTDL